MEQLNVLKSCPFSPGAIWSEQQVMSIVKIHLPVLLYDKKIWLNTRCNFVDNKHFCTSPRLNAESFKCNFNGFKRNLTWKKIKNWGRGRFRGSGWDNHQLYFFMRPKGFLHLCLYYRDTTNLWFCSCCFYGLLSHQGVLLKTWLNRWNRQSDTGQPTCIHKHKFTIMTKMTSS